MIVDLLQVFDHHDVIAVLNCGPHAHRILTPFLKTDDAGFFWQALCNSQDFKSELTALLAEVV